MSKVTQEMLSVYPKAFQMLPRFSEDLVINLFLLLDCPWTYRIFHDTLKTSSLALGLPKAFQRIPGNLEDSLYSDLLKVSQWPSVFSIHVFRVP